MPTQTDVIDCYNKTAKKYAENFLDELSHKHLDKLLLNAFANDNKLKGAMIDLGCGPGQTTKYLSDAGVQDVRGLDLSPVMVKTASELFPQLPFETGDMLALHYPDQHFGSAIGFYSIVHFSIDEMKVAFTEIYRVLKTGGDFLFSFHIGNDSKHFDVFLDQQVNIDFHFFDKDKIVEVAKNAGFSIIDVIERQPYADFEYASQRAYVWVRKRT